MDKKKMREAINKGTAAVNALCEPGAMTKSEQIEFLEEVICNLEASLEAAREEADEG